MEMLMNGYQKEEYRFLNIGYVFFIALISASLSSNARALSLGDPAPPVEIAHWIKGGPVDLAAGKGKKIYVIEFWKTACPYCVKSVSHLSELQKRFMENGVVVIGITKEAPVEVTSFLADKEVDYHLASDDGEKTNKNYMEAFGIEGVPHAFVIDRQQTIVWEGHPLDGLERALEELVQGRYDLENAKRESSARKMLLPYLFLAIETREDDITRMLGERILEYGKNSPKLLDKLAWRILSDARIVRPDFDLALKAIDRAYAIDGKNISVLETYGHLLRKLGRIKEAKEFFNTVELLRKEAEKEKQPELEAGTPKSCED